MRESVPCYITLHLVLLWQRRHCTGRVVPVERLVQEEEIAEPSPNRKVRFLERLEIGLPYTSG